jgi:hypothetical protein
MIKIVPFALLIAVCLISRAVPVTDEGMQVREIAHAATESCKFRGMVDAHGKLFFTGKSEAKRDVLNKIRNGTVNLSSNASPLTTVEVEWDFNLP